MISDKFRPSVNSIFLWTLFTLTATITWAVNCPPHCKCSWVLDSLEVDCSRQGLQEYPNFHNLPIQHLDLSHNAFVEFPKQLADIESLIYLDLSNNRIDYLDADALLGFTSLRTLLLTNNSITGWRALSPNRILDNAINLKRLSLSGNKLGSFTDRNAKDVLVSESLNHLELVGCNISAIGGDVIRNYLPNLEHLTLSRNTITSLTSLPSESLRILELSNCKLTTVPPTLLKNLPNLEQLDLSWNTALQFGPKLKDNLFSTSLNILDVSYCNLDEINLKGLSSLTKIHLRSNMLRTISTATFANNTQLETIDISRNALRFIDAEALSQLKRLTKLDLSFNEIALLDKNLFRSNDALVALNLSRNVIEKFTKLVSNSLRDISLSWCEIISIDPTAFTGLAAIQRLDLSNNLIKDFPSGMRSVTLQTLDLTNCRLSTLRNNTFRDFPELASLYLNGNRFTNPFSPQIFRSNKYLDQIWLGDNPWICNCDDNTFVDFYGFLTEKPPKLKDKTNVRCASPSYQYGKTWESACLRDWMPSQNTTNAEKVWTTIMLCLLGLGGLLLFLSCCQKYMRKRKRRRDTDEYRENHAEMEEIRRQNQRMLEEEGTHNAPTLFETNLPSYEDAIRMPKLERPIKSMLDLTASHRARKKLQRSCTDPEQLEDDLLVDNRQRFRSEEMLSNRDKERTVHFEPSRRTGYIEYNASSRRFSIEESRFPAAHLKSQNLQSAEQIGNFQSYENSPYTKRKPKIAEIPPFKRATIQSASVEFLTDPECEDTSKPGSPFARRKPRAVATVPPNPPALGDKTSAASAEHFLPPAIDDYFGEVKKSSASISPANSDYQILVEADIASLPDNGSTSPSDPEAAGLERNKRKKLKNSSSRRASGNFTAAAAAAGDTSSSDKEPMVDIHKPMRETLF